MGYHNAAELQAKVHGGKREMREFEPKVGKLYNIWFPENKFYYIRKHFQLGLCPASKGSRLKAINCINTDLDAEKQVCPICDYTQELWDMWKKETTKPGKEKIQNIINKLTGEYSYINGIDLDDPDLEFQSFKFSKGVMGTITDVIANSPIETIMWSYKKTDVNKKITYIMLESVDNPRALEMVEQMDALMARKYADGGLIDLDAALAYPTTQKEYLDTLSGKSNKADHDDGEVDPGADLNADEGQSEADKAKAAKASVAAAKAAKEKKANAAPASKVVVADDATLSLDEISLEEDEKPPVTAPPAKTTKTTVTAPPAKAVVKASPADIDIDLDIEDAEIVAADDIDLDDISLDETVVDEDVVVSHVLLNENKSNRSYVNAAVNALVLAKNMVRSDDHVTNLRAAYAYLKSKNTTVIVKQSAIDFPA